MASGTERHGAFSHLGSSNEALRPLPDKLVAVQAEWMHPLYLSRGREEALTEAAEAERGISTFASICNTEAASPLLLMESGQRNPTKTGV